MACVTHKVARTGRLAVGTGLMRRGDGARGQGCPLRSVAGCSVPTPIQRLAVPVVNAGRGWSHGLCDIKGRVTGKGAALAPLRWQGPSQVVFARLGQAQYGMFGLSRPGSMGRVLGCWAALQAATCRTTHMCTHTGLGCHLLSMSKEKGYTFGMA